MNMTISFLRKNFLRIWPVWAAALLWGTMLQLNWIFDSCPNEPLFGSGIKRCQDNIWRIGLGGPAFIIFFIGLFIFEAKFLIRKYKAKNASAQDKIIDKVVYSYIPFLSIALWPFFNYHEAYLYSILIPSLLAHFIMISESTLRENFLKLWPVWASALFFGIMLQLNWIHENCLNEPFIGSSLRKCQDNALRISLGGPAFILLFVGLFALEMKLLIRGYKAEKTPFYDKIVNRIIYAYTPFLGVLLLPFFDYNDAYLYFILALSLIIHFIMISDSTLSPEHGDISFEMEKGDVMAVKFTGKCVAKHKESLYEIVMEILGQLPQMKEVKIYLDQTEKIDSTGKGLISILAEGAKFHSLKVKYTDPQKRLS